MGIKETLKTLPDSPGVYLFKDKDDNIIYIGKAVSLKRRVASYFKRGLPCYRTDILISNISSIDFILTNSEEEALLLEAALIKEKQPKFNVLLKDDKRYPLLKLTLNEKYPRLIVVRKRKNDKAVYFGPYTSANLLRKALGIMRKIFPLRTCKTMPKTPCLNYHIGQCIAPCLTISNKINQENYGQIVDDIALFLKGKKADLIKNLTLRMKNAASNKNFEEAARIRDQMQALTVIGSTKTINVAGLRSAVSIKKIEIDELQAVLGLQKPPLRIEAFDISDIYGKEAVGSMVSFFNGMPDKKNYKRFKIKGEYGINDYSMMQEVVKRRYERILKENSALPDLIIIDGGKGHVSAAKEILDKLDLKNIAIIGIAKKEEKIFFLNKEMPVKKDSKALQLIQRIRDEAHRFAQGYHHILRKQISNISELDRIPGIGPVKKRILLKHFFSVDAIKNASLEKLEKILDEKSAGAVYKNFNK